MKSYLDMGGRLFGTHWFSYDWVQASYPTAVTNQFGSNVDNDRETYSNPAAPIDLTIDTSSATGSTFSQWLNVLGASPGGVGTVRFLSWRHLPEVVSAPTLRLAYGDSSMAPLNHPQNSSVWGGPLVGIYQFNTPYGGANPCGRVEMAMSHVSQYGTGSAFPGPCGSASNAMTAQEEAFEFLIFNSQQCLGLVPTPAPPGTTGLPTASFTRDYQGVCPSGYMAKWGVFYWEATIPTATTQIAFSAATADTQAMLPKP
jgi:hypothetical protein